MIAVGMAFGGEDKSSLASSSSADEESAAAVSDSSMSDSDLTSTDSDDSLALSESESITDVTPLNSPYCDSPHHSEGLEIKSEQVNVLMKAIEKLEVESRRPPHRRRTCGVEEGKRLENQRLFKKVISQQSRMRSMYPPSRKNVNSLQEIGKSDGDGLAKGIQSLRGARDGGKYAQRHQKCLSHPSYSFSQANQIILADDECSGGSDQNDSSLQSTSTMFSYDICTDKQNTKD